MADTTDAKVYAGIPLSEAVACGKRYAREEDKLRPRLAQTFDSLIAAVAALQAEVERAREMNRALADDLCAAESEAARLREDAARLDWAQQHAHMLAWTDDGDPMVIRADDGAEFTGETLRAAIDAAMGSANGQADAAALHQRKDGRADPA